MVTSFLCKDLKKNLGTDLFLSVSNSCHGVGGPLLLWHARNYLTLSKLVCDSLD
jgi:hypothetical protein